MPVSDRDEKALKIICDLLNESKSERKITEVYYRDDYQDFQVILDDNWHCEIREKLIDHYAKEQHNDVRREILFRLENAIEYEDWESQQTDVPGNEPGIAIDDSEKYDI